MSVSCAAFLHALTFFALRHTDMTMGNTSLNAALSGFARIGAPLGLTFAEKRREQCCKRRPLAACNPRRGGHVRKQLAIGDTSKPVKTHSYQVPRFRAGKFLARQSGGLCSQASRAAAQFLPKGHCFRAWRFPSHQSGGLCPRAGEADVQFLPNGHRFQTRYFPRQSDRIEP